MIDQNDREHLSWVAARFTLPILFCAKIVADDSAILHHKLYGLQHANIGERITAHRDDVRVVIGLERTRFGGPAKQISGANRGGLTPNPTLPPPLHHFRELLHL